MCQSKSTETNSIIIKEYIDRKYKFYAGREYLMAKICPTEGFYRGQADF